MCRRAHGRWIVPILVAALAIASGAVPVGAQGESKISSRLLDLMRYVDEQAARGTTASEIPLPSNVAIDAAGRVRVVIAVAAVSGENLEALRSLGAEVETHDAGSGLVQARVPLDRVRAAAGLPFVRTIRLPSYGQPNAQGSVATEGEAVVKADAARQAFGVTGSGIRVGVISDGIATIALATQTGNLPPTQLVRNESGLLIGTTGGVTGRSFRADGSLEGLPGIPAGEGTALLEIVHDVAPGAELHFAAISTDVEFVNAVKWLAEEAGGPNARRGTPGGVDIIVNDFSFLDLGPLDGGSPPSLAATAAAEQGVAFFTSAGNSAREHYRGVFADPDGNTFHNFAEGDEAIRVTVPALGSLHVVLQWDDPWTGSSNDYDVRLFDAPGTPLSAFGGTTRQTGAEPPIEVLSFVNGTTARVVDVRIENVAGRAAPRTLNVFVVGTATPIDHNVPAGSVAPPADARGAITVGAVRASAPTVIEGFSAQGPTLDGRLKPELVAPDAVSTTVFGTRGFVGTSAAAPHAAAVGALLLSLNPRLAPDQLQRALEVTAADLGESGADNVFGFGLVNALAALGVPQVDLRLNAASYRTGDALILDTLVKSGSALNRGDAYLVALIPTGGFVSLVLQGDGSLQLVEGLVPLQRGFDVFSIEGPIYRRAFLPSDPRGAYVVVGVLVLEGRDPFDQANWIVFDIETYTLEG
jgi:hypothetical protein